MVHCRVVSAHPNPINVIENSVVDLSPGENHEVRVLTGWRKWCRNDTYSLVASYPYATTPRHLEGERNSGRTMVFKVQNRGAPLT